MCKALQLPLKLLFDGDDWQFWGQNGTYFIFSSASLPPMFKKRSCATVKMSKVKISRIAEVWDVCFWSEKYEV